ncbi:MAG: 3-hydroxyacyl-CoA dehydrogenase NAD-binding domain-containing protein [Alphaproteobacteria bacterium]|nr:3-hydroxyacyl-CoA dehydrogenase NAD-binding domain-containing protein [Alphaproteobacteria bacterium]
MDTGNQSLKTEHTIGIIGSGQMGSGIAQVCAASGYSVYLFDVMDGALEKARKSISSSLLKFVEKEKITDAHRDASLSRLAFTTKIADLQHCSIIIEAVPESLSIKQDIFQQIGNFANDDIIVASNTSSLSITALSNLYPHPKKFVGLHFMNPVPMIPLVEVICGADTSSQTIQIITDFAKTLGKTVVQSKDSPGFIVNRILLPTINEAIHTLADGIGSAEDIDIAMKLGANWPIGPLALADLIGLDTCLAIMNVLENGFHDKKYAPCPLLKDHVQQGKLGRKTGEGFYKYDQH